MIDTLQIYEDDRESASSLVGLARYKSDETAAIDAGVS